MKRQEALDLINNIIKSQKNNDNLSELILNELELAGMLPPLTYLDILDRFDNFWED